MIPLHPDWPSFLAAEKERMETFLIESSKLDRADYTLACTPNRGYYGALVESQGLGFARRTLSPEHLLRWHAMICEETDVDRAAKTDIQEKLRMFTRKLADKVANLSVDFDMVAIVEVMAFILAEIEGKGLFHEANGRLARLLVNYVATYNHIPVIVFTEACPTDLPVVKPYLAGKVREAVFDQSGRLLTLTEDRNNTSLYTDSQGHQLYVEWHALANQEALWRKNGVLKA